MKTPYLVTRVTCSPDLVEILMVWMGELGYEAFEETAEGFDAYIRTDDWSAEALNDILTPFQTRIHLTHEPLPDQNWNAIWESAYESVEVGTFCQIVPSFRQPKPSFVYTLLIDPKMSFGTGHHETTQLMIQLMEQVPFAGQSVLDMGCGTGVLGILAMKMGAQAVYGIDIDPWSEENSRENALLNNVNLSIALGDAQAIPDQSFGVILANINRNVLLEDLKTYVQHLLPGGQLLLSGFLRKDESLMLAEAEKRGLEIVSHAHLHNWAALALVKAAT